MSASGSNTDDTEMMFNEFGSGLFPQQPESNNSEPDVFLVPPLPGFVNDHNDNLSLEFEAIQPGNDDSAEDDDGFQTPSDKESTSSGVDIDSGSAPLDEATLQAGSSTVPSPIPLIHSISWSGGVDENSPDPFSSHADTRPRTSYLSGTDPGSRAPGCIAQG
ncbi:uncharacterized protein EI90DRAFT_3118055 [Cantharellus anzutake]|uniref:uncharacterized protein n=1 Tax=Cantharellus anzutake TaxID=1750568 RepID=UPI0019088406|nr:uncharacterized protein EI90DRAFT_3118055 [Cantharellus anzutake]KAF8338994.1 hypothetical protein EI90DRAFT_3118055 [Cantharellus anzutake]